MTASRPESEQSTIDIAQIEKSFPAPPKSSHGCRKTLPPLPPMAELERDAAEAIASEEKAVARGASPGGVSPVNRDPEKKMALRLGESTMTGSTKLLPKEEPRPTTASTRRLSFVSVDPKRNLKYGVGKYATVELSPQPSEDPNDPLNWPLWKRNLNFAALLSMVAVVGAMKTALVSVHGVIAAEEGINYTSATALTAVPLMISALSGMASAIIAKIWGKRPVYLVSTVLMFVGSAWNINTGGEFAQNLAARIFQGLGWGAFDTLVLGSILDTFFEHERQSRILLYNALSVGTTWGAPLIGSVASMGSRGFLTQFEIFTTFIVVLVMPLLVFGAPETTYRRLSFDEREGFPTLNRSQSKLPKITLSKDALLQYLRDVKFQTYKAVMVDRFLLIQALRAAVAPSTLLLFILTLVPHVALWGLTSSLPLFFSPPPFRLMVSSIGLIFFAPFLLGTTTVIGLSMLLCRKPFSRVIHLTTLAVGAAFASIGILAFGLYIVGSSQRAGQSSGAIITDLGLMRNSISFPLLSFLLGLLAFGSATLDGTIHPVIQQSTAFTSANMSVALRNIADMQAGLTCFRSFFAGVFVLGLPVAVRTWDGLRGSAIGMGVVQIFVTCIIAALYFDLGEDIRRLDGVVMGLVDLSALKNRGSFFDSD